MSQRSGFDEIPWALDVGAHTDVGKVRSHNEDTFRTSEELGLFVVADGMGGHEAGEYASLIAVEALLEYLWRAHEGAVESEEALVREAFLEANRLIVADADANPERAGMGTTMTALLLSGERFWIGHVGDSRAWLLRDGVAEQLTRDHSVVAEQVEAGLIDDDEAAAHPMRNVLTRVLGNSDDVEVDVVDGALRAGDAFVLASDGIMGALDGERIAATVADSETAQDASRKLVDLACREDGHDNATAVVVRCETGEAAGNASGVLG